MTYKIKSVLYFASFVVAVITYYQINTSNAMQNTELADNFANASNIGVLK